MIQFSLQSLVDVFFQRSCSRVFFRMSCCSLELLDNLTFRCKTSLATLFDRRRHSNSFKIGFIYSEMYTLILLDVYKYVLCKVCSNDVAYLTGNVCVYLLKTACIYLIFLQCIY